MKQAFVLNLQFDIFGGWYLLNTNHLKTTASFCWRLFLDGRMCYNKYIGTTTKTVGGLSLGVIAGDMRFPWPKGVLCEI